MKRYKLTDQNLQTHGGYQWVVGEWHKATGDGKALCTDGWLHCYDSPELAVLLNPIHAGIENPRTPAQARFSIKYVVAHALRHGSVRLAAFEAAPLADPATRALMGCIEASIDPELDAAFPAQRAARVSIETRDGRRHALLQPARKGDPEMPLSDRELEAKYLELTAPVVGDAPARALLGRLWRLERETRVTLAS